MQLVGTSWYHAKCAFDAADFIEHRNLANRARSPMTLKMSLQPAPQVTPSRPTDRCVALRCVVQAKMSLWIGPKIGPGVGFGGAVIEIRFL